VFEGLPLDWTDGPEAQWRPVTMKGLMPPMLP